MIIQTHLEEVTVKIDPAPEAVGYGLRDWCKHLQTVITHSAASDGTYRYREMCACCMAPTIPRRAGFGEVKAVAKWGGTAVALSLHVDELKAMDAQDRLKEVSSMIGVWKRAEKNAAFWAAHKSHMRSNEWQEIRARLFEIAQGKCNRCDGPAEHAHHLTYERLGAELIEDLEALCAHCHHAEHGRVF